MRARAFRNTLVKLRLGAFAPLRPFKLSGTPEIYEFAALARDVEYIFCIDV
jgi:hypothetical protein